MSTPIITFDVDGVLAGGGFIPEMDRRPEVYEDLPLLDLRAPDILNELTRKYSVYIVSSRRFENALDVTRRWLNKHGFHLSWLSGVLCVDGAKEKVKAIHLLGSRLHVDDSPEVLDSLDCWGVLFLGLDKQYWWAAAKEGKYSDRLITCYSWGDLSKCIPDLNRPPQPIAGTTYIIDDPSNKGYITISMDEALYRRVQAAI